MAKITLTAKRQATLPRALCEEMGVGPGDQIDVERQNVGGEIVWLLRTSQPDWSWVGIARRFARAKSHRLEDIRRSVARGRARERRR